MSNVTTLYEFNFRDAPKVLREIASELESPKGEYGATICIGVAVWGKKGLFSFGAGPHADPSTVAMIMRRGAAIAEDAVLSNVDEDGEYPLGAA